jgi:hypothetical protein
MLGWAVAGLPGISTKFDAGIEFAARVKDRGPGLHHESAAVERYGRYDHVAPGLLARRGLADGGNLIAPSTSVNGLIPQPSCNSYTKCSSGT